MKNRLFYDIETSFCKGHFWRPGYKQTITPDQITEYAKIISIHYKFENHDKVHHLHWGLKKQCDRDMIAKFVDIMNEATEIVTHNGKRFDTPWIRTRAIYHNIDMRHTYNEIDTYKLCKKYLNLPSNSLKEACRYFGLPAKRDPGGIETWKNIVFNKDKKALDNLLYYGDGDVLSLQSLYEKLRPYVKHNMNYATHDGLGKYLCPECGKEAQHKMKYTTAHGTVYHYMRCSDRKVCRTTFKINNKTYQDFLTYKINKK